ncbi:hypothetical protein M3I53_33420 [Paraburkholderia sp. CNPSo 3272]|uniref:hypothetical protein n=1 Tax=Paraburkholderia sp. CNPSo 3272 TaxID=2940931 RepID=UPI0020B86726|nr:hypothetical protein [Paraburkholderia sp. CNPSo 3272]MCP3727956.1 hypothetical protein [Paraburkholderia sp. CNPSo 3272]
MANKFDGKAKTMTPAIEQETSQHPQSASQNTMRVTTREDAKNGAQPDSPYTAKNLDGAITHLEIAIAFDGNIAVFGRRYWLDRVQRIASTPEIMPAQARRLRHLLDQLEHA